MFFTSKKIDDIKNEYRELMKKWHPDVTKESYDTTSVVQNINIEYQQLLRGFLFTQDKNKNVSVNKDIEEELKTARQIYVNIYEVHPRIKKDEDGNFFKYHDLKHIKSKLAYNEKDAANLIKNMKEMKLYTPHLTEQRYDKCDRIGFIYRVEYGKVVLKDLV